MIYFNAFLVGGIICMIAQLILDLANLTPGHITCLFVLIGSILDIGNIYDKLIEFSEAGALIPITSFGHSVAHGNYSNILDVSNGIFSLVSSGITSSIVIGFIMALIFKPKG